MEFKPGDNVTINHTGQSGTVTYPGISGIPNRVYVRHPERPDLRLSGITLHYHPTELTLTPNRKDTP